jgi:5-methylcytosine-specific restriction endonuclease McrA
MDESKELVKQYLKRTKKNYSDYQFSDADLEFLARYSVKKEGCESKILKDLGLISDKGRVQDYYAKHEAVKKAKDCIQKIYERFSTKRNDQKKKENPVNVFDNDFESFFAWWCEKTPEDGIRKCYYCEVDEDTVRAAFAKDEKGKCVISSKKRSFSGELQIERKNPDGDYCDKNCEFACVICNNAKSDMISAEDFTKFFVPGIKEYWKHIEEEIKKKNP